MKELNPGSGHPRIKRGGVGTIRVRRYWEGPRAPKRTKALTTDALHPAMNQPPKPRTDPLRPESTTAKPPEKILNKSAAMSLIAAAGLDEKEFAAAIKAAAENGQIAREGLQYLIPESVVTTWIEEKGKGEANE